MLCVFSNPAYVSFEFFVLDNFCPCVITQSFWTCIVLNRFLQFGEGSCGLLYLVLNGVFKLFCSKALCFKWYVFFLFTRVIMMTFLWTRFARFLDLAPFSYHWCLVFSHLVFWPLWGRRFFSQHC